MSDIRIISGKRISPAMNAVFALLGYRDMTDRQTSIKEIFDKLLPEVKMHICPKAAFTIKNEYLYVMLTLGDNVSRLIEKYQAKEDMLSAMVLDAMADSCLFAFEEQLLPTLQQICKAEGYGVEKRLEIPDDIPIDMQKTAYEILEAKRTLNITMTSGYMLNPVKSMSLIFKLTEDTNCKNIEHDCSECSNQNCQLGKKSKKLLDLS